MNDNEMNRALHIFSTTLQKDEMGNLVISDKLRELIITCTLRCFAKQDDNVEMGARQFAEMAAYAAVCAESGIRDFETDADEGGLNALVNKNSREFYCSDDCSDHKPKN